MSDDKFIDAETQKKNKDKLREETNNKIKRQFNLRKQFDDANGGKIPVRKTIKNADKGKVLEFKPRNKENTDD